MIAAIGKENMNWTNIDKPNNNPADAAHLRKFGAVMAAAFGILSAVAWWHDSGALPWTLLVAAAFLFAGLLTPISLAPLEKIWMALAEKMSIVMTLLILTLTFFVLITPIGLLRRLFHAIALNSVLTANCQVTGNRLSRTAQLAARTNPIERGIFMPLRSNLALIWDFLKVRKKWWLAPIILFLLLVSLLIVLSQGSVVAPFIYTLF